MEKAVIKAPAKVNLSLDVLRKREDGYHELAMVMQSLSLHDTVTLERKDEGITVSSNHPGVPSGEDNIAVKAARALFREAGYLGGASIHIEKRIPVAAGLAGGSTDAAAVLKGLNQACSFGFSGSELARVGKSVGADVPYCLWGGTVLAEGIGEKLTPLETLPLFHVVLVKPPYPVSTAQVYRSFKLAEVKVHPDTDGMVEAIGRGDRQGIVERLCNVLETVTLRFHPELSEIKEAFLETGALGTLMSGSGPTVFGLFASAGDAARAALYFRENMPAGKTGEEEYIVIETETSPAQRSV